jgi:hypothetical protein
MVHQPGQRVQQQQQQHPLPAITTVVDGQQLAEATAGQEKTQSSWFTDLIALSSIDYTFGSCRNQGVQLHPHFKVSVTCAGVLSNTGFFTKPWDEWTYLTASINDSG